VNIVDAIFKHASLRPQELAVAEGSACVSWSQLAERVEACAGMLHSSGVVPGDRVALCAPDGVHALIHALAVLRLGAVHTPIDHGLAAPEIAQAISSLQAPWLLHSTRADVEPALSATNQPRQPDPLGDECSAFLRSSSGTTGNAKGVLLSHTTIAARLACANRALALGPEDRVLWLLPMAYHFAVSILLYIERGSAIIFGNSLRASTTATWAREHAATFAYGSPYHVRRLAELPPGHELPSSLRSVVATTTALDADTAKAFRLRHRLNVRQALGIIEVGLPFVSPGDEHEQPGQLGRPVDGYAVAILDQDGNELSGDAVGELAISGPGLFDAYVQPWQPRAAILHNGYFRTGDSAGRDANGAFRLLGRYKDVINVGGVKVFPLEVEAVLDAHPAVVASRVGARRDERTGEHVVAEVQLRDGIDRATAIDEIERWCAERLAALKRPALIEVVDVLPKTGSGKVKRAPEARHAGG
jgi:long-chain acyl-CoA synthetase